MKFTVPQFVDIEDKIAFQLTAKQLGWFGLGGILMFFAWMTFSQGTFIVWAIIIAVVVGAFAFYRPAGLTLVAFLKHGFVHLVRPKIFIWRVEYQKKQDSQDKNKKEKPLLVKRKERIR